MKRLLVLSLLVALAVLVAACTGGQAPVPVQPTQPPGTYTIIIYKVDEIGDTGQWVVYHLHCLYYVPKKDGAALYERYHWAVEEDQPPSCEQKWSGFPLQSGDTKQIGRTDKKPDVLVFSYNVSYYAKQGPASGFKYDKPIAVNQTPPECSLTNNELPLYDCTVLRK